jgi:hypothetical protein
MARGVEMWLPSDAKTVLIYWGSGSCSACRMASGATSGQCALQVGVVELGMVMGGCLVCNYPNW